MLGRGKGGRPGGGPGGSIPGAGRGMPYGGGYPMGGAVFCGWVGGWGWMSLLCLRGWRSDGYSEDVPIMGIAPGLLIV